MTERQQNALLELRLAADYAANVLQILGQDAAAAEVRRAAAKVRRAFGTDL